MSQPYIGEIRMFGGNFAPLGWAFCDGQLMAISENDALFNLIGTTYGGDGQETFGIPDLRGRTPLHMNANFIIGENGGVENVTVTTQQMAAHGHPAMASVNAGTSGTPGQTMVLANMGPAGTVSPPTYLPPGGAQQPMSPSSTGIDGGSQPHNNIQPSLGINYIISLYGIYPTPT